MFYLESHMMNIQEIKNRCAIDENGCWNWTGAKASGYGRIKRNRKFFLVHRLVYQVQYPDAQIKAMDVCHHCDNRACCNPEHLFLGTRRDNMIDCSNKGRLASQNGKHVKPKHDDSFITAIVEMRRKGMAKRSIAATLGWTYSMFQRYEKRHSISY